MGLAAIAAASVVATGATHKAAPKHLRPVAASQIPVPTPVYIGDRITQLGRAFDGQVGIAVAAIDDGWFAGWKAGDLYPQQSVSKLWVAITALDAVDRGKVSLDDPVTLTKPDPLPPADRRGGAEERQLHDDARRPDAAPDYPERQHR
jgi:beta-lactamase class A